MNNSYSNNILATLCYVVKDGKVLMLHRIKKENDMHRGKYNGLGGKMEKGETPYECVAREVREEAGIEIKDPLLSGIINFPDFDGKNNWLVFVFLVESFHGNLIDSKEGILEWIDIDKISELNLWEGDYLFLKYVFEKKFFYASFYYSENKLIDYRIQIP
ncbi:MAG: 8-oxo-dGTP diphosphatase [Elusimicrobiota bacterium]